MSPDGTCLAVVSGAHVKIINLHDGSVKTFKNDSRVRVIWFSPDGKFLAALAEGENEIIKIMNLLNDSVATFSTTDDMLATSCDTLVFSSDSKFVGISLGNWVKIMQLRLENCAEYLEYRISEEQKKLVK